MTRDEALRILGLDEDATEADIKLAYKEMAQILHPDKFGDNKKLAERATEQFKNVNAARETLLSSSRSSRSGTRTRRSAGSSGSAGSPGYSTASSLKARLAGIAAARTQLTAQLDAEIDRRRVGIWLLVGGVVGMIVGVRIRIVEPLGGIALISGAIQTFSAAANIKTINGHLASLDEDRKKCEEELENL
jgi:curved DNA-binding protein CbpA